jgi:hypothetical protein
MITARARSTKVVLALGLTAALLLSLFATADASSHREAPLITEDPVADNTDLYAFVSPDDPTTTTFVANWIPFENPAGGPNFYNFGDDVLYTINVDNDGDAVDDVSFEFRFTTEIRNPDTFLYATGPITVNDDGSYSDEFNLRQTYTVAAIKDGVRTVLGQNIPVPPNNVGERSTPNYDELAQAAVTELDGGFTTFAGQRDEVFYIDLGSIFDLGGLRPFNEAHLVPLPPEPGSDATAGFNVHSIALQVPNDYITGDSDVVGVYTTTHRRSVRVFAGNNGADPIHNGPFVQVSRLGMPLVNEVVIPLGLKDAFNALDPIDDVATLATEPDDRGVTIPLVQDPELGRLIPQIYPGAEFCEPSIPRNDLVSIFLTGIEDLNQNVGAEGTQPSEMLRLNTGIAPTGTDPNEQDRLGLLAGEADGFPNGRRLGDDTVDISLRAVMGATPLGDCNGESPNQDLTDGVTVNDKPLLTSFPYIPAPHSGYDDPNGEREE